MMTTAKTVFILLILTSISHANDETPDVEFLEWLGQVTEVEDLGVDINGLLEAREQETHSAGDEERSK